MLSHYRPAKIRRQNQLRPFRKKAPCHHHPHPRPLKTAAIDFVQLVWLTRAQLDLEIRLSQTTRMSRVERKRIVIQTT